MIKLSRNPNRALIESQEPLTVQAGKFEKPQLKKTVKKTVEKSKKASMSENKENEDGVNYFIEY